MPDTELNQIQMENEYLHMRLEEIRSRAAELKAPEEYSQEYRCIYDRAIEEFRGIVE